MHFHTVLFAFPEDSPQEVGDTAMSELRSMHSIPAVRYIAAGPNMFPVSDGWTHGMTIAFDSFDVMMSDFAKHPDHVAVFNKVIPTCSKYMAMDVATEDS